MGDGNFLNARVHASTAGERVTETLILSGFDEPIGSRSAHDSEMYSAAAKPQPKRRAPPPPLCLTGGLSLGDRFTESLRCAAPRTNEVTSGCPPHTAKTVRAVLGRQRRGRTGRAASRLTHDPLGGPNRSARRRACACGTESSAPSRACFRTRFVGEGAGDSMSPGLTPSPLPVRAMRCQRRTGEGRASSLTCVYASAASSMPLTEAAWRREHAAHHIAASETQQAACVRTRGTPLGGRTAAVGWASAAALCERACDGSEKLRPKNKTAKTNGSHSAESFRRLQQTHFLGWKG